MVTLPCDWLTGRWLGTISMSLRSMDDERLTQYLLILLSVLHPVGLYTNQVQDPALLSEEQPRSR